MNTLLAEMTIEQVQAEVEKLICKVVQTTDPVARYYYEILLDEAREERDRRDGPEYMQDAWLNKYFDA
jgi:hypothetical protein